MAPLGPRHPLDHGRAVDSAARSEARGGIDGTQPAGAPAVDAPAGLRYLLLADISGSTSFMASVEQALDHREDHPESRGRAGVDPEARRLAAPRRVSLGRSG